MRRPGDARGSRQRLALRISRYIMRDGLLPTDALLISYLTGRGVGAGGTAADPLAGTLDASGAWLLQLGLRWAEPRVLVPGLNPMLALRDYCAGLGAEFCDTVTSALHLAARHRLSAPPPQFAQALVVPGSQLDTTQPFPRQWLVPIWPPASLSHCGSLLPTRLSLWAVRKLWTVPKPWAVCLLGAARKLLLTA